MESAPTHSGVWLSVWVDIHAGGRIRTSRRADIHAGGCAHLGGRIWNPPLHIQVGGCPCGRVSVWADTQAGFVPCVFCCQNMQGTKL